MRQRNRKDSRDQTLRFGADWKIATPALVIGLLYGGLWLLLAAYGRGDTALARALLLVAAVAVPALLLRAWLRYTTSELRIAADELSFRRGWFGPQWRGVPLASVAGVRVAYGLAGRYLGGNALVLSLAHGGEIRIADIGDPEAAAAAIEARLTAR